MNYLTTLRNTKYPLETFLDFLFSIVQSIERKKDLEDKNLRLRQLINRVHIIQGTAGRTLSLDKYYAIPNMPYVLDFISKLLFLYHLNQKEVPPTIKTKALTTTPPENPAAIEGGTTSGATSESKATRTSTTSVNASSTDLLSDTGGIHVNVQWPPAPISMNTFAKFNFTDVFSGGDLMYI